MKKTIYHELIKNFLSLNKEANDNYKKTKALLDQERSPVSGWHSKPRKFNQNKSPKA